MAELTMIKVRKCWKSIYWHKELSQNPQNNCNSTTAVWLIYSGTCKRLWAVLAKFLLVLQDLNSEWQHSASSLIVALGSRLPDMVWLHGTYESCVNALWWELRVNIDFLSWLLAGNIWTFCTWDSEIYNDTHHLPQLMHPTDDGGNFQSTAWDHSTCYSASSNTGWICNIIWYVLTFVNLGVVSSNFGQVEQWCRNNICIWVICASCR